MFIYKFLKVFLKQQLPLCSVVGTSSMRRLAQLKSLYPHLNVVDVVGSFSCQNIVLMGLYVFNCCYTRNFSIIFNWASTRFEQLLIEVFNIGLYENISK